MPFIEKLTGETGPMRIYDLCKLIHYQPFTKEQVRDLLQPPNVSKGQRLAQLAITFCQNGALISETENGTLQLRLDPQEIETPAAFRRAMANLVFSDHSLVFAQFTAWYLMQGEGILSAKTTGDLEKWFNAEIHRGPGLLYNETNITGWKPWARFLGLGFLHNKKLIPNAAVRVQDFIYSSNMEVNKPYLFREFMSRLQLACPELDGGALALMYKGKADLQPQHLSMALSSGLRALHDQGVIELRYVPDAQDTWHLLPSYTHLISGAVSEITIKEVGSQ